MRSRFKKEGLELFLPAQRAGTVTLVPQPTNLLFKTTSSYLSNTAMALRTFRSNPSLGGFGSESTAPDVFRAMRMVGAEDDAEEDENHDHDNDNDGITDELAAVTDCDAFAQIIKELVDNAVDACCMSSSSGGPSKTRSSKQRSSLVPRQNKRVRVVIGQFQPIRMDDKEEGTRGTVGTDAGSSNNDPTTASSGSPEANSTNKKNKKCEILRVTVSDNGCGMEDMQGCVEAFRSSKAGNNNSTNNRVSSSTAKTSKQSKKQSKSFCKQKKKQEEQLMTSGRYGIGLTLCLLHAQRLVPNSRACITSATEMDTHFTRAQYVVDTEGDSVRCVERTLIPKVASPDESGTSVSLLIPVSILVET